MSHPSQCFFFLEPPTKHRAQLTRMEGKDKLLTLFLARTLAVTLTHAIFSSELLCRYTHLLSVIGKSTTSDRAYIFLSVQPDSWVQATKSL